MAGRILNRRELRRQSDSADQAAEQTEAAAPETAEAADDGDAEAAPVKKVRKAKAKAPAGPKVKRVRKPKAPPRMFARWGVYDAGMKQVAVFDYTQRAAAEEKLADLLTKKKGTHFLQLVKEAMPEPEPAPAAASPVA